MRATFVTAEFALAWPLLVASGLLLNSFVRLQRVDPGFDPRGLVAFGVDLPTIRYPGVPEIFRFRALAMQRLAQVPGVRSVGIATDVPPDPNFGNFDNFNFVHQPVPTGQTEPTAPWYYVGPTYFSTLGVRLLEGREFTETDTGAAFPVAIVSASFAKQHLPGESAVGRQFVQGGCYACPFPRTTIIGVVEDVKNLGPAQPAVAVYGSLGQSGASSFELVVRLQSVTPAGLQALQDAVRAIDPELPLAQRTVSDLVGASTADPMRWAAVLTAFAACGLGLAALGVFGLMAYAVRQRQREIGVRLALGAEPRSVTRLVVSRGMRYAAIGSAIGVAATLLLVNRIRTMLFEVKTTDIATFAGVGVLLLGSALLASWIPARRAARIRPIEAISVD
jgi:putative ABC transport system permease protein